MIRLPRLDLMKATRLPGAGRLAETAALLRQVLPAGGRPLPTPARMSAHTPAATPAATSGRFLSAQFGNHAGSRAYRLYVPGSAAGRPMPLLVMLHGCAQSPEDFAAGTRMNAAAEAAGCLVAYPEQTSAANASRCWNWFSASDQQRGRGEPALLAGLTAEVMRQYPVDPARVYVAGLSAGAATAANLGALYPELFAAIGVHSGLASGAARDMPSAFAAMRDGAVVPAGAQAAGRLVPAIVFHGDRDSTVHPRNGEAVIAQAAPDGALRQRQERGQVPGGRAYTRTLHLDRTGHSVLEHWEIHGAGHAWSGGSTAGSFTDPLGPDATHEMLRFFLEHTHPRPAALAPAGG